MQAFINECRLCYECLWFGFSVGIIYHFLIFLKFWPKNKIILCIREMFLGVIIATLWFFMMLSTNNANIKIIYVLVTFLGTIIYYKFFGKSVKEIFNKKL